MGVYDALASVGRVEADVSLVIVLVLGPIAIILGFVLMFKKPTPRANGKPINWKVVGGFIACCGFIIIGLGFLHRWIVNRYKVAAAFTGAELLL